MGGGGGLEIEGLTKRFGNLMAVRDLSFGVQPGEVFGFVGSNGAGKTTTMRIVLGTLAVVLSVLPAFAPVLMPARIASGDAQAWQVLLAAGLTIAAIVGLNALAARIYANSVLRVGSRLKLLEAWRGRA